MRKTSGVFLAVLLSILLIAPFSVRGIAAEGWTKEFGGTSDDRAYSLIQTSDGGYALAGQTQSFGAGDYDFWLVKTDTSGAVPEFASILILQLFIAASLTVVVACRKRRFGTIGNRKKGNCEGDISNL